MSKPRNGEKDKARRSLWIAEQRLKTAIAENGTPKRIQRLRATVERQLQRYKQAIANGA